jgi:hypothetical protein
MQKIYSEKNPHALDGKWWFRSLVEGHDFSGSGSKTKNHDVPMNLTVHVELPGSGDVVEIPKGAWITFFQPYPQIDSSRVVFAIFLKDEQITMQGSGRITRRRF